MKKSRHSGYGTFPNQDVYLIFNIYYIIFYFYIFLKRNMNENNSLLLITSKY